MAKRFAAEAPAALVLADIDNQAVRPVADEVGGDPVRVDVSSREDNARLIGHTESRHGPIDLFCANAGQAMGGDEQTHPAAWDHIWQVNLMSHVHAARLLVPGWVARGEGYFLSTASAAGLLTNLGAAPYSVTKHAAVAFAEWLAITYGDQGIRVSCLCPMGVKTPLLEKAVELAHLLWPDAIEASEVADHLVEGLRTEQFLILPHPEVKRFFQNKASDYDRWIAGMRKLQRSVHPTRQIGQNQVL